jgi:hypothetical protein
MIGPYHSCCAGGSYQSCCCCYCCYCCCAACQVDNAGLQQMLGELLAATEPAGAQPTTAVVTAACSPELVSLAAKRPASSCVASKLG